MRQKLHEDDKRKRVNVLLSNNERELLKEKMDKYGYADLSSYLRDAGIYERLYLEDIDGKKEISELVSNMIGEIRKYLFEQNKILMKSSLTRNDIQLLSEQNDKILESNMNLVKLINELLLKPLAVLFNKQNYLMMMQNRKGAMKCHIQKEYRYTQEKEEQVYIIAWSMYAMEIRQRMGFW